MIDVVNKQDCCGCTACYSICPKSAITMVPDAQGFLYPKVDESLCVECGLCESVCSFNDSYDTELNLVEPKAFAARHKQLDEVEKSRSGAVFVALTNKVLDMGGVVYGAGLGTHLSVIHKRATTREERDEFRKSKYVQSDLGNTFNKIKNELKKDRLVYFSGTPCQVAGLSSFVGPKLRKNLVLQDIVCHGVPGPKVWGDYVSFIEKRENKIPIGVDFRDKNRFGWDDHKESFIFADCKKSFDIYSYLFNLQLIFRESCKVCYYTNMRRPSDITLGDFWGFQNVDAQFNLDNKGVSLVLCNTVKGVNLLESVKNDLNTIPVEDLSKCMQPNLQHPTRFHPLHDDFVKDYTTKGFKYALYKYGNVNVVKRFKRFIKKYILRKKVF